VELAGSDAWLSLMANVDAASLFNFPLRDITNLQCWLYTLGTTDTVDGSKQTGFSIVNAALTTASMNFDMACATCTSSSLSILPEILELLKGSGVLDVVEQRVMELVLGLLRSDYAQDRIDEILMDASLRCPHSPKFIGSSASLSENPAVAFPSLDYKSLETITFVSTVVTQLAAVVVAQAHESYELETSFPLSGQHDFSVKDNERLVDFTSLEESVGEWASSGVDNLIAFLNEVVTDPNGMEQKSDLRVNNLIRSTALDENGELSMSFDALNLEKVGIGISLNKLKIVGLDTISELNILDTIGAQTIKNRIGWEKIRFEFVLSLIDSNDDKKTRHNDFFRSF